MKVNSKDNKCGIYLIRNLINGKVYIGKSVNIYKRIVHHKSALTNKMKKYENDHFINAWHKYGKENFAYTILEECNIDELKEKELYWIQKYDCLNREKGYNFRYDSESGMIPNEETRKKYSLAQKKRFSNIEEREKLSKNLKKYWSENKDQLKEIGLKISKKQEKYNFIKLNKNGEVIETFSSIKDILKKYPHYKASSIYSSCRESNLLFGYYWKKECKI